MKAPISFVALFGLLLTNMACTAPESGTSEFDQQPGALVEKNPVLPTTYVDTSGTTYAWHKAYNQVQAIRSRIRAPEGYKRVKAEKKSFAYWLQGLPLKPGRPDVKLYDGSLKGNQGAHFRVLDMDVGKRDLQQCADAVMRLRAEYQYSREDFEAISFNFTSGDACTWEAWRKGIRPKFSGNKVSFRKTAGESDSYKNFRSYMNMVFSYAGTASLAKELKEVPWEDLQIGDVFIQGGFPGHAILVMDMAVQEETGEKLFLLAQSYMPAQEMHILNNPMNDGLSPWYSDQAPGAISTPEWTFEKRNLKRW